MLAREEITTIVKKFNENGKVIETKEEKVTKEYRANGQDKCDIHLGKFKPLPRFSRGMGDFTTLELNR